VRLVGPAGEQVGIVRIEDALRLAAESDLDLVEVAPLAKPPVCKLMDFGKYKYEAAVKAREARKNQTNTVLKEIRFRLKIDTHDYETKRGHALRFLAAGDKVKAMIQFRGREQQRPEMGIRLLNRFAEDVAEVGLVESTPRIDGRNMVMVIGPVKNKAEAKAEARRVAQRADDKARNEAVAAGTARVDVDRDNKAPMTQSLADLLPEGYSTTASAEAIDKAAEEAAAAPAAAPAPQQAAPAAPVQAAPAQSAPAQAAPARPATTRSAPGTARPATSAPRSASTSAPRSTSASAPRTATSAARPATAAPRQASAPRPASAPSPAAAVTPAQAKPTAAPRPVPMPKPMPKPAAAKPAAKPAAAPKPASRNTPAKGPAGDSSPNSAE
jgi:translation initiation factor IF-3